jgi:hypothetical protein
MQSLSALLQLFGNHLRTVATQGSKKLAKGLGDLKKDFSFSSVEKIYQMTNKAFNLGS